MACIENKKCHYCFKDHNLIREIRRNGITIAYCCVNIFCAIKAQDNYPDCEIVEVGGLVY